MEERSVRRRTMEQRLGRACVAWRRKVLALAKENVEKAFDLWWPRINEDNPWVKNSLSEAEAKKGFLEELEICKKQMKECRGAMFFPNVFHIARKKDIREKERAKERRRQMRRGKRQ